VHIYGSGQPGIFVKKADLYNTMQTTKKCLIGKTFLFPIERLLLSTGRKLLIGKTEELHSQ
jgi:hypothetical protein